MKSPLFSIIVPVYNLKNYVTATISSVLGQSFGDFELLIVDDGSTDGSAEIINNMAERDNRVKVFHKQNSGVSAARNTGLDHACGEWIVFLDGDDGLQSNALEILAKSIAKYPSADMIGYGHSKVNHLNPTHKNESFQELMTDSTHTVPFLALDHYTVWSVTFKRTMAGELRFKPLRNGEDVLFCNSLAFRSSCYLRIDANLYLYLQREASAHANAWSERRCEDYAQMNRGIYNNISASDKQVDRLWLRRWIGSLLQYTPDVWNLNKDIQKRYFNLHKTLLQEVRHLHNVPTYLKAWISIVTAFNSKRMFRLLAMMPMRAYSRKKRLFTQPSI